MSAIHQLQQSLQSVMTSTLPHGCDCTIIDKFEIELDSNYEFTNATCLAMAVLKDDTAAVETSLGKGCHVNYGKIGCNDEGRWTPLIMACRWSSLPVVALLIGHPGIEIDKKNGDGETALSWAVRKPENLDMARLLVRAGAKISWRDCEGHSSLYRAVEEGALENVKYLQSKGASVNTHSRMLITPMWKAATQGNLPMVRYLVQWYNGSSLNGPMSFKKSPFCSAVKQGNVEIVKFMIEQGVDVMAKDHRGDNALEIAQEQINNEENKKKSYEEIISMLKAAEADFKCDESVKSCDCLKEDFKIQSSHILDFQHLGSLDDCIPEGTSVSLKFRNLSCLGLAVLQDNIEAAKASLKKGCDVNFDKNEVYFEGFTSGFTPLMLACLHSSLPIISLLVEQPGIEIDKFNENAMEEVALAWAVRRNDNLDMVKLMVEAGADPDMRDFLGISHLHRAAAHGQVDIVQYLQSKGADVNTKAKHDKGTTPLWFAADTGDLAMVKYLVTHGAFLEPPLRGNSSADDYYYPLQAAVRCGHVDVVRFLIQQGADVNLKSGRISNFEIAQIRYEQRKYPGSEEILGLLKDAGAKEPDNTPEDWDHLFRLPLISL